MTKAEAKNELAQEVKAAIVDAYRHGLTDEELTQTLEGALRQYFMARVYPA
jgi:hypothetical protein